jgi:outer membrane protein assembly factor BamB
MLEAAPHSIIDLDAMAADTLVATRENQLGHQTAPELDEKVRLSKAVSIISIGDTLYVADSDQHTIFALTKEGTWVDRIGREGRGPGEFSLIYGLFVNEHHIYALDMNNGEIDVFDHSFRYQKSFPYFTVSGRHNTIAVSNKWLLAPAMMNNQTLITQYDAVQPFDTLDTLLQPIVPRGYHPMAQNRFIVDATPSGDYVLSFPGLPYLFVFDAQHHQTHTIYLTDDYFDTLDNPSLEPVKNADPMSMGVRSMLNAVYLESNGSIWISVKNQLYELVPEDNEYSLKRSIIMPYSEEVRKSQRDEYVTVRDILIDDGRLFISSTHENYIYKFDI